MLGQHVGQVVQGLDPRTEGFPVRNRSTRGDHDEPVLIAVRGPHLDGIDDNDDGGLAAFFRIDAHVAVAAGYQGADVGILEPRLGNAGLDQRRHLRNRHRNRQRDGPGRIIQSVKVSTQFEYFPVVGADPFEDAVAVQQPMVEYRNLGGSPVTPDAVNPDDGHRVAS